MTKVLSTPQYLSRYVQVTLPKFRIETSTSLVALLMKLGVSAPFDPLRADLSGIAGTPGAIHINRVIQKTYIDVNEHGVEAAAVTAAIAVVPSLPPQATYFFNADHPFIFYIKVKDVVLFEGRFVKP